MTDHFLTADWPAPVNIRVLATTRRHPEGHSRGRHASFNLGWYCGDDRAAVMANRRLLERELPAPPLWLRQQHGVRILAAGGSWRLSRKPEADGCFTRAPRQVCAVLSADCLPLLLCARDGSVVAAVHAGWRGLYAGIIQQAVTSLRTPPGELLAWLGPAISRRRYEVDAAFRQRFVALSADYASAFGRHGEAICADLYELARIQLAGAGVDAVYGGGYCTHAQEQLFYSYRRDGVTGRQATLIWRD